MPNQFQSQFGRSEPFGGSSLFGSRVWGVDSYGRCVGKNYHIWKPGENTAVCKVPQRRDPHSLMLEAVEPIGSDVGCKGVEPHCQCGFYAFYTPEAEKPNTGAVGIIEGYGLVTEGPLGFRSMKAKIVALVLSESLVCQRPFTDLFGYRYDSSTTPSSKEQVQKNYPDVRFFDSISDMYAEFPLSSPQLYDPDEPGFWEKPIE